MATCKNCGCEVTEGSAFCQNCGARVETEPTPVVPQPTPVVPPSTPIVPASSYGTDYNDTKKKGGKFFENKKLLGIIGAAVAVILVVVLIVNLGGSSGPEGMLKNMAKTLNRRASGEKAFTALYMNEYSADVEKAVMKAKISAEIDDEYDSLKEALKESFEMIYDEFDDEYGDDWKVTVEVKKAKDIKKSSDDFERCEDRWDSFVEDLEDEAKYYEKRAKDNDDYEEIAEIYEKYADKYDKYKVTAVKEVKFKISIKGDDDKDSETATVLFAKVNGKWICMDSSFFF